MKLPHWLTLGGVTLGVLGTGLVARTFLPLHLATDISGEQTGGELPTSLLPDVEVTFLRCGSNTAPACLAVRGTYSLAPRRIAYSAVLIRHPKGTFLYDTGLCANIQHFLKDQPLWFRTVFGNFVMELPIGVHLQQQGMKPQDLDFVLLSHLHWDHVSGIPDLAGVPLRIHRVEYEATQPGVLSQTQGMVKRLLCDNPLELFDLSGPAYVGFEASYDLFGDGSVILVPLPGHTDGQVGMFILRANGGHLFLIADAVWLAENYQKPAPMHPLFWSLLASDKTSALHTLSKLHRFSKNYPEVSLVPMHDAVIQENFGKNEL